MLSLSLSLSHSYTLSRDLFPSNLYCAIKNFIKEKEKVSLMPIGMIGFGMNKSFREKQKKQIKYKI